MIILGVTSSSDKNVPTAPTIGTATNVGTGRAYNNGAATVTFTPTYDGGLPVTYTATSSPGGFTATGSSPITVTGLQSNTAYTFTVTATNSLGSATSAASNSITATTVPQAPTIGTATDGGTGTTVSVAFTPGATGGSAVTTYTATSSPGSITGTAASSPITVTGLTTGTAYTFTVTATNANGTSTASAASNSVTPAVPGSFDFIAKADGPVSSITFSSIPQTYKHLELRWSGNSSSSSEDQLRIQCNASPPAGSHENWFASNNGLGGDSGTLWNLAGTLGGTNFGYTHGFLDIYDYTSTNQRTGYGLAALAAGPTSTGRRITSYGVQFTPATAITSLILYPNSGSSFASNFTVALYGIKDS